MSPEQAEAERIDACGCGAVYGCDECAPDCLALQKAAPNSEPRDFDVIDPDEPDGAVDMEANSTLDWEAK